MVLILHTQYAQDYYYNVWPQMLETLAIFHNPHTKETIESLNLLLWSKPQVH